MEHGLYIIVLVATVALTTAMPHGGLDLSVVLNRTLCPTVVEYDENFDRIPRVIRTLVCKENPDDVCAALRRPEQCCRARRSKDMVYSCVQVTDTVLVRTKDLMSPPYAIPVAVGCSCLGQEVTHAQDVQ